ncbi:MAG: inorganic diphosphatase [Oxalobacter sp.]|nr:inorganic diphosphatase [Oxalobacter sp.]
MNIWHDLSADRVKPNDFTAVIEIAKGSKVKYELDKDTGMIVMDRILHTSTQYPANYGFIPKTYADDGDPLDVLLICSETLMPNTLVRCFPIGVIMMEDGGDKDEKIIALPYGDPVYNGYKELSDIPEHIVKEMAHFFSVYKALEGKKTLIEGVKDRKAAEEIISACIDKYNKAFPAK